MTQKDTNELDSVTHNEMKMDAASSLLATLDDREAVCYLCLDGGVDDEDGQQLRRNCACRGTDAGFVHFSCLRRCSSPPVLRSQVRRSEV